MELFIVLLIVGVFGFAIYKFFYSKEARAREAAEEKQKQIEKENQINHYASHPLIINTAKTISADICDLIDRCGREAYVQDIKVEYGYVMFSDGIDRRDHDYYKNKCLVNFEHERIEDLTDSEKELVGKVIFSLVEKNIKEAYPKDPGGLNYSFICKESIYKEHASKYSRLTEKYEDYEKYGTMFVMVYSCKNGKYRDKTRL